MLVGRALHFTLLDLFANGWAPLVAPILGKPESWTLRLRHHFYHRSRCTSYRHQARKRAPKTQADSQPESTRVEHAIASPREPRKGPRHQNTRPKRKKAQPQPDQSASHSDVEPRTASARKPAARGPLSTATREATPAHIPTIYVSTLRIGAGVHLCMLNYISVHPLTHTPRRSPSPRALIATQRSIEVVEL